MLSKALQLSLALGFSAVFACPDHNYHSHLKTRDLHIHKRAETGGVTWSYEASYDWGRLSQNFTLCQTGTQQAPIPLLLTQGLSLNHIPDFSNYANATAGTFFNWGYGPSMTYAHAEGDYTTLPAFTFNDGSSGNETVYMSGWHIHSPADHTVANDRSKAEMHFVHVNATGAVRAVLAFRIDPGNQNSAFFSQLPPLIDYRNTTIRVNATMNPSMALDEVNHFNEFWTYKGSLTSPPCTEGIRWYLARNIMFLSNAQMQDVLRVSHYSARAEQEVWSHQINV